MMFELAAPIQFSVPQTIVNRDGYIPVVGGGGEKQSSWDMRFARWWH